MTKKHAAFELCFALCVILETLAGSRSAVGKDNEQILADHNADVIAQIAKCAVDGEETVLSATGFRCAEYQKGVDQLDKENGETKSPQMPLQVDASQVCSNPNDKRVLSARAIKTIVNDTTKQIDPTGIRVIGAVFCDTLDLIGLKLQYSLVFDRSIFVRGIDARDFRTNGDLSFDGSLLFGELRLARAHIDGTIFGSDALIQKAEISNSEIKGSLLFRNSLLLEPTIFDTVRISGELSLRRSAFPYFILQFGNVRGVLDLTGSQARCSYQLRTSKIGDLVLDGAGFGDASPTDTAHILFDWDNPRDLSKFFTAANLNRAITQMHSHNTPSPMSVSEALDDKDCGYGLIAAPSVLVVSDISVDAQLCLRDFHWLSTPTNQAASFVTFNDVTVGATAFIDLIEGAPDKPPATDKSAKKQLEILGLRAHTLIVNFGIASRPQSYTSLYANGLAFSQVYTVDKDTVQCGYNPDFAEPSGTRLINGVGNLSQRRRPQVEEVMQWLSANKAETTQPFSAFVDVFQKDGETSAARELQIRKADAELGSKIARLFNLNIPNGENTAELGAMSLGQVVIQPILNMIYGIWTFVTGLVSITFGAILWLLADNGYRPAKVGWFVGLILLLSFAYFWFWEKVIAIRPKKGSEVPDEPTPRPEKADLPVGLTFLFDRLLPAYQIREDHYKIAAFLKRVPQGQGKEFQYFWMRFYVTPADGATVQRVERALDVIKFFGLVLTIFLVAALNALVSH